MSDASIHIAAASCLDASGPICLTSATRVAHVVLPALRLLCSPRTQGSRRATLWDGLAYLRREKHPVPEMTDENPSPEVDGRNTKRLLFGPGAADWTTRAQAA